MPLRILRPEALLYFPAMIIGGMCALGGLAWLYERTRKKVEHPRLGRLTFYGDHWVGTVPHYLAQNPPVRIEVPGTRKGPDEQDLERLEALWPKLGALICEIRPHAVEDLEDAHDAVQGTDLGELTRDVIERVATDPAQLDSDWTLSAVALQTGLRGQRHWCLEFEVSWDAEHQRSAYLDLDGRFLRYEMSCAVVDL